ncbi:hypothetical protein MRB56_20200 [Halomonas cupida]|uniref:hypothetical protein n=1 Tax=Halomonas cupida TaxID=44933 RepID=UPI00135668FF|nr:hypothetical protein [Halomonas cupida]
MIAAHGRAAVVHQADARPHHTSRPAHLRQCGAGENQIDQDELFDCHVNSAATRLPRKRQQTLGFERDSAKPVLGIGRRSD